MALAPQFDPRIPRPRRGLRSAPLGLAFISLILSPASIAQSQTTPPAAQPAAQTQKATPPSPGVNEDGLPRGKKLMLKDGSFQLVREYQVDGDRVRYYSMDQRDWEEIPAALVDWDATKKVEAEDAQRNAAIIAKVHALEVAHNATPMDIDASIEVAPKVFLPPGEGVFEFDGKSIRQLSQAEADIKFSKSQMLKQVLVPIPIVPTRHTVSLKGTRAKFRIKSGQIEFYMRTADGREPDLDLLRAKIHGGQRDLENLDQLFKQEATTGKVALPIQRWQIAQGVYRFTLGQDVEPGEYAIAEVVQGGTTSLYFWDFGVDPGAATAAKPSK
ncbi:MAG: hypothetical protein WA211_07415 [Candidatus Acidiferrales bacterium]